MEHHYNKNYIHHGNSSILSVIRELVFGIEDGMVSTLGAITGIAVGSNNHFIVVLSGLVIIAVESLSMAVGSYLSTKSEHEVEKRKLFEEKEEIHATPKYEAKELLAMYVRDGWPKNLAKQMVSVAQKNKKLMLDEMSYRELKIIPNEERTPLKNAVTMYFSYIVGGTIPILPYFFFDIAQSITLSIIVTLIGLFLLGMFTTRFTKRFWLKAGFEILALGSFAVVVGYFVGTFAEKFITAL